MDAVKSVFCRLLRDLELRRSRAVRRATVSPRGVIRPLVLGLALAPVALAMSSGTGATAGTANSQGSYCPGVLPGQAAAPMPGGAPVTFGIYPGGLAGQILPVGSTSPDVPAQQLAALNQLRPGSRPFVVHLYATYTGNSSQDTQNASVSSQIGLFTEHGYLAELVLTYRPAGANAASDVAGFVSFVRSIVRQYGPNPGLVSLQVTNEANFNAGPNTSDGAYPGVEDALIQGIIAAKAEIRQNGYHQIKVGFNWFHRTNPDSDEKFWTDLDSAGGPAFRAALDWVGLDAYPGTFFPPTVAPSGTPGDVHDAMVNAFSVLRCFMQVAKIRSSVPIHISENGYPTGDGRSEAMQASVLQAEVQATVDYRANYNITDYRLFDLRDSDSNGPDFEQHYGIMTDDYSPKPAFAIYRGLVAEFDVPLSGEAGQESCPSASGRLAGSTLGAAKLGMTRARVMRGFTRSSTRGKRYMEFFCLTPIGIRVGYPSPKLLRTLSAADRGSLRGRVILALTANPHYALRGVRPGARLASLTRRLGLERPFPIGLNRWYLAPHGSTTGVLKVRHGVVEEIGIAEKRLTATRAAARRLLTSFS